MAIPASISYWLCSAIAVRGVLSGDRRCGLIFIILLLPVLVVLIVLVRMGVSDSFVGMFVGVLALRTGLPIMCVLVATVGLRMLVGMS